MSIKTTKAPQLRYRYSGLIDMKLLLEKELDPRLLVVSCLSCKQFDESAEVCNLYQRQRPPARVIAFGCSSYADDDDIPF